MKILLGEKPWNVKDVLQLREPEKIVSAKKFNAMLTQFKRYANKKIIGELT